MTRDCSLAVAAPIPVFVAVIAAGTVIGHCSRPAGRPTRAEWLALAVLALVAGRFPAAACRASNGLVLDLRHFFMTSALLLGRARPRSPSPSTAW